MILAEHTIHLDEHESFRIYPVGDCHLNLRIAQRDKLQKYLRAAENDPAALVLPLGDLSDARPKEHRFFVPEMLHPSYNLVDLDDMENDVQRECYALLGTLAEQGKVPGLLRGNHHRPGFTKQLCWLLNGRREGDVWDLGDRCMIRVRLVPRNKPGRAAKVITVFAAHFDSGGRKKGAQVNNEIDNLISWQADVYLFAHSHKGSYNEQPRSRLKVKGKLELIDDAPQFINAGAWLDPVTVGANHYSDQKNLPQPSKEKWVLAGKLGDGQTVGRGQVDWTPRRWKGTPLV